MQLMNGGWLALSSKVAIRPSPNFNDRPADTKISLLVIHNISLPPGEFNTPYVADLFLNRIDINADPWFVNLKDLKGLVRLHLEKTKITDDGLEQLKGLENLEYLNLYGTAVTDAGLKHLEPLKKLKKLYLWQTQVTDAGVAGLKVAIPELQINRGVEPAKPVEEKKAEEPKAEEKK